MKMTRVDDPQNPGEFCWTRRYRSENDWVRSSDTEGVRCLAVVLPGDFTRSFLPVEACEAWLNGGVMWWWDGNEDAPTLTPSVDCSETGGWHGFIRAGELVKC